MTKKPITISICLSPELVQLLDEKRKQMNPRPPSRAKAVVMLLQKLLGGHDEGYNLVIRQAEQSDARPGKLVDVGTFRIKSPDDVE